jgi:hypothetical protein
MKTLQFTMETPDNSTGAFTERLGFGTTIPNQDAVKIIETLDANITSQTIEKPEQFRFKVTVDGETVFNRTATMDANDGADVAAALQASVEAAVMREAEARRKAEQNSKPADDQN